MSAQETFWDLDLPVYRSKFLFCGECAERRPYQELHPIGKAGGLHFERTIFDLSEFDTVDVEPGFFESLELGHDDNADDSADRRTREKLNKIRGSVLYAVLKNAPRIDFAKFTADVAEGYPHLNPKNLEKMLKEQLGFRRSTASPSHLALVRLDNDEPGSVLTCWSCSTRMAIGREHVARAVEHTFMYGGDILVSRFSIDARESGEPFERKTHRRKKPSAPPPVLFRRGTDFVASGFIPESNAEIEDNESALESAI